MAKRATGAVIPNLEADPQAGLALHAQVYRRLRQAILDGTLGPGARLPSTRTLAADLGVSRTTAEEAFAQLDAEGYLVRKVGDGSYVADVRAEQPLAAAARARPLARGSPRALSARGLEMARTPACEEPSVPRAFRGGLPALDEFPIELWQRLLTRRSRRSGRELLGYGDPAGYLPLREAVAEYLGTSRGVRCLAEQVVILTSSQQALDLAARLLLDPGQQAWLEEPGYRGARVALLAAGARIVPVPVDGDGLDVAAGCRLAPGARLACVTPSHQNPLGGALSLERRLALLAWAERAGAWILEDDYDSEFRYEGRPVAAIQGLDAHERVIYVGTFSKVLFPSLRLAYLVVPRDLVARFVTARTLLDGHTATLSQAVAADFIREGHFGAHLRRMRALYRQRRDALVEALARESRGCLRLGPAEAGLQLVAYLEPGSDDRQVVRRAARRGVDLQPLSLFYVGARRVPGLLLGYAGLSPAAIRKGARELCRVL